MMVLLVMVVALYFVGQLTYRKGLQKLADQGSARLELHITYLLGLLEKYESLPELLANDKRLINFLMKPGGQERINALNKYLETINSISDASDTYLMDREGLTIAASNWNEQHPFVGRNFSYRPYFQEAMQGHLGRYFALGATSSRRGYYFAYPVRHKKSILGALVVKIGIDSVEKSWRQPNQLFLVTDPDGVIFFTTDHDWRYRTLYPLDDKVKKRIVASRRYPNASLEPLDIVGKKVSSHGRMLQIAFPDTGKTREYLLQSRYMDHAGWNVQILSETKGIKKTVVAVTIMTASVFLLGGLVHLIVQQRRQRLLEVRKYEDQARKVLEDANKMLEIRVDERTAELTATNQLLRQEIDERSQSRRGLKENPF